MTSSADKLSFLPSLKLPQRYVGLAFMVLVPLLIGELALFLGQDANWDLRNYHWYNPYAFLKGRYGFDLFPSQTPSFYNPLLDVPFYWLASHVPARVAGYVLGAVQGINFSLLFLLSYATLSIRSESQRVSTAIGLSLLGILGGGGIALIGTTFYDNVTSLGFLLSMLLVLRNTDILTDGRWTETGNRAFVAGIPAGLMMGLKLPGVIFCVGLCGAFLCVPLSLGRRVFLAFVFGCGIITGCLLTFGSWGWFLYTHLGNPVFPYFNDFFHSPLTLGTSNRDTQYVVTAFKDVWRFPYLFAENPMRVGEIFWRDWRIPILYFLLPLTFLLKIWRKTKLPVEACRPLLFARRYLVAAGILAYLAWLKMFCIYRYLIPLEMLAPLLLVFVWDGWPVSQRWRAALIGSTLVVVALSIHPGDWTRRKEWTDHFVEVRLPPLGDPSDLMILMAGGEPYSHLIPEFPEKIPFIRIQSNFSSPEQGMGVNRLFRERIEAHTGRLMLLIAPWQHVAADSALHFFHLQSQWQACQKVVDVLYDNNALDLCPVVHSQE